MIKWVDIKGYLGIYKVSNNGYVINTVSNRILTRNNINGYAAVTLCLNGKNKIHTIHRLVAIHFIDNPNSKPQVNHKDGYRLNNNVENLEWCTASENAKHAYSIGLSKPNKSNIGNFNGDSFNSRSVLCKNKNGDIIFHFECIRQAAKNLKISESAISNNLNGLCKTSGGFIWEYV